MNHAPVSWTTADISDQTGRRAVVTGATSGLGAVVARELARAGAGVVLPARDRARGERARSAVLDAAPGAVVEVVDLDLLDLDSVRRGAAEIAAGAPVDVLVANAGIMPTARVLSPQGLESTWATSVVGHFALTGLLLAHTAPRARVVLVGSDLYRTVRVPLPLGDPADERRSSPMRAYTAAKLGDVLLGLELHRRLTSAGSSVRSLVAHPGVADTPLQRGGRTRAERTVSGLLRLALGRSVEAGALPILYAATAPDAPAERFLGPSLRKHDLRVHAAPVVAPANDLALATRLWTALEEQSGVPVPPDLLAAAGTAGTGTSDPLSPTAGGCDDRSDDVRTDEIRRTGRS